MTGGMRLLAFGGLLLLGGCSALPQIFGVVSGAIAGGATANPAVGFAVGVGVDAATDVIQKYVGRTRQGAEQDAIAAAASGLPDGGVADWRIDHDIPIGNEHGRLMVVRSIDTPLAICKEIAFSVLDGEDKSVFTTTICRQGEDAPGQGWKWAAAEPATQRWGFLQ